MRRLSELLVGATLLLFNPLSYGARNQGLINDSGSSAILPFDIQTEFEVNCDVGAVHNRISNSTVEKATGTNDWTILIGDDALELPSMRRQVPPEYAAINDYLYFASLRIGYNNRLVHFSNDTSDTLIVDTGPGAISDFDTYFYISDQSDSVPLPDKINIAAHARTFAWDESDANDFIIYDFWFVNLNDIRLDSIYVALHADCDVSAAGGGSGAESYSRDDLVGYYRDNARGEFVSYMYDGDNPTVPGNDEGGRLLPRESMGFIGSRLLYCPPIMGETTPSVQQGHGWWDWNSDPGADNQWFHLMSDRIWADPPPSPHDYRFLQKLGPFTITANDSIHVVFAFGIGDGTAGLRANLDNATLLFENDYVYYNLPPNPPTNVRADTINLDIGLNWDAPIDDDIVGYYVNYATDPVGPFQRCNQNPVDTAYFMFSPGFRDVFYFYVTSVDTGGAESNTSDTLIISNLPQPPGNLRAYPGSNSVRLIWRPVSDASSYRLHRSLTAGGPYSQIAEVIHPDTDYTDNSVTNFQTYYYVATTSSGAYESQYSGEVEVTPGGANGRVLLVDDFEELDHSGNPEIYQEMRRIYERWGVHHFDYDLWVLAEQGMPSETVLSQYQAVVFASDAAFGESDFTWWFEVGAIGGGVLRTYLDGGGRLLAIGSQILPTIYNNNPPRVGDFEYDWFGIDSTGGWDWWVDFTWAIGENEGFPDSMKIDVGKNPDQIDYASTVYQLRQGAEIIFTKGLDIGGFPPNDYGEPIASTFPVAGTPRTFLINFDLKNMPNRDINATLSRILRDGFGCTYYQDPAPLPPWRVAVTTIPSDTLRLTWDAIDEDDVTLIKVYRADGTQPYNLLTTLGAGIGTINDVDIVPGTMYHYKLACVDFTGQEGAYSVEVSEAGGRPNPPTNLSAQSGDNEVMLQWSPPGGEDIQNLRIYRKVGFGGNWQLIDSPPPNDTAYYDLSALNGSAYYFYMTSMSIFGVESYPTDSVLAYPHAGYRFGILVVNGVEWATYGPEITDLYQNRSVTGYFPYQFWDLFETPPPQGRPFPETVIGVGPLPEIVFDAFNTIIWVGNNFNGDLEIWNANQDSIISFLNSGGNLFLLCRFGEEFLFDELRQYAHITAMSPIQNPTGLTAVFNPLTDIQRIASHSFSCYVNVDVTFTRILYRPQGINDWSAGIWYHSESAGDFVHLVGRPYRHNNSQLRSNCEIILRDFLGLTGADDGGSNLPREIALYQNYPNPFNPNTKIKFALTGKTRISLIVYDLLGRKAAALADGIFDAGYHEIIWNGNNGQGNAVTSGVYFYRLVAGDKSISRKMVILK
jgi:fibronectin type 3 domain-containing protein